MKNDERERKRGAWVRAGGESSFKTSLSSKNPAIFGFDLDAFQQFLTFFFYFILFLESLKPKHWYFFFSHFDGGKKNYKPLPSHTEINVCSAILYG